MREGLWSSVRLRMTGCVSVFFRGVGKARAGKPPMAPVNSELAEHQVNSPRNWRSRRRREAVMHRRRLWERHLSRPSQHCGSVSQRDSGQGQNGLVARSRLGSHQDGIATCIEKHLFDAESAGQQPNIGNNGVALGLSIVSGTVRVRAPADGEVCHCPSRTIPTKVKRTPQCSWIP